MSQAQSFELNIADRRLIIETGKLAGQADAGVTVRYGDTVVLVTVCVAKEPRVGGDFLPLTVDYEERLYAAGKIPGGFIRREGRPSEQAILACRLVDRPIRPLLPKEWRRDIQLIATVFSADQENDPDILAVIGSSAVLTLSEVPFYGPIGAVRVGYINGQYVLNPTLHQLEESQLDLVVASTKEAVVMLEAGAKEIPETLLPQAIRFGHEANQEIIKLQEEVQRVYGRPKVQVVSAGQRPEVTSAVSAAVGDKLSGIMVMTKAEREAELDELKDGLVESLTEVATEPEIAEALETMVKAEVRASMLKGQRLGGRALTEIRPLSCEVGVLPRTHGSGLFTRGLTQVLTITTLGSTRQEQLIDGIGLEETKRFMHHYNFPPFSTGEVKRMGSPGRRDIGHVALAERALLPVVPKAEDFPYTIRLVSEVLSSSGSTSMASVCASSLSLMDAGIPIKKPVAGVAMGLVTGEGGQYVVLTDIEGLEDAYGDMDFKAAGTSAGLTALQMDIKLKGVSFEIIEKALTQSVEARGHILEKMRAAINASRPEVSPFAPRMYKMKINPDKIGAVIGTGGKTIRSIIEATDTTVDVQDDGTVVIGSPNEESARKAMQIIERLTKDIEVGEIYTGKVTRILDFGAMVEILPGKEGLVHISELADFRVGKVEDVVKAGDEVTVKVVGVDNLGRVNLSRRAVFEKPGERREEPPRQPRYPPRDRPYHSDEGRRPGRGAPGQGMGTR